MRITGHKKLAVSAPSRASTRAIMSFVDKSEDWITAQDMWGSPTFIHKQQITESEFLHFVPGDKLQSHWDEDVYYVEVPAQLDAADCVVQEFVYSELIRELRKRAKSELIPLAESLARLNKIDVAHFRVKNSVSRWGSFSSNRNLNLNLQLMRLSDELQAHVIIHELAHSIVLSHSAEFWEVFEKMRPGARQEQKILRKHSLWRRPC